jgi:hypothetical protein
MANKRCKLLLVLGVFYCLGPVQAQHSKPNRHAPFLTIKPRVIRLAVPAVDNGVGGIVVSDVNDDGRKDFIVTRPNLVAVYDQSGRELWIKEVHIQLTKKAEEDGLPGLHAPGVQAADVDGDGAMEILYLTQAGELHVVEGATGREKWRAIPAVPQGAERWEHLVVANFRGKGDRDLLLQGTNAQGYRMGRFLAAYAVDALVQGQLKPLWQRDDFVANAHNGARIADLDGDGKDEILGGTIVSAEGKITFRIPVGGHLDSIFAADVNSDTTGLEVVALEEGGGWRIQGGNNPLFRFARRSVNNIINRVFPGGNRVFLYNSDRLLWDGHYKHQEPQNAAVGEFDTARPGLEVWCRSRYDTNQKPFVFDARGRMISTYDLK